MRLNYLDKVYLVTMTTHQLAILLCFETKDSVTMDYIEKATGLSGELLTRNVRALVDANLLLMSEKVKYFQFLLFFVTVVAVAKYVFMENGGSYKTRYLFISILEIMICFCFIAF